MAEPCSGQLVVKVDPLGIALPALVGALAGFVAFCSHSYDTHIVANFVISSFYNKL